MGFIGFLILAAAVLLLFAGITGRDPRSTILAILRGEPLPEPEFVIEADPPASAVSSDVVLLGQGGGANAAGWVWPIPGGKVTSGYGMRGAEFHHGVDIPASTGTPIRAARAGTVTAAEWRGGYGNATYIDHGNGLQTRYAHQVRTPPVRRGQQVSAGQVVGYVGSTGRSSGPHLHFEVRINGVSKNPLNYVSG